PAHPGERPALPAPRLSRDHHDAPGTLAGQRQDTAELTHFRVTTHHRGRLSDHRDTLPGLALPTRMIDRPAPTRMISASVTFTRAEDVRASATGHAFANGSRGRMDLGEQGIRAGGDLPRRAHLEFDHPPYRGGSSRAGSAKAVPEKNRSRSGRVQLISSSAPHPMVGGVGWFTGKSVRSGGAGSAEGGGLAAGGGPGRPAR